MTTNEPAARAWSEEVTIPTYGIGAPNKNPMFLEKRVYQGSSGVVYPRPVVDWVSDQKADRQWLALFLENRWLKIMILPELGGRVQMALDKTNDYHLVYYNRVIKPALVGLCGPWISGGIEFNWPQHHRPSTYEPVQWRIENRPDGSVVVWCHEVDRMFRMESRHGFVLRPDAARLDIEVHLGNRSSEPQTFLWWANPAVHVNDDYQSVFPPDVHAVMDHGKRAVSDFPIATGEYYKVNYAPGTDIARYKNIPVPTSYMAYHSDYDFVGCYDHGKQAGMLHVANHHLVPGKKQWTWGTSDFGQAWDRQLTDADGPYIELMCGAFTDNQPDFSWLAPGEEKAFEQSFMPYKQIGPCVNATRDAVLALEIVPSTNGGKLSEAKLGVYATRPGRYTVQIWSDPAPVARLHNHKNMRLPAVRRELSAAAKLLFEEAIDLTPETAWRKTTALGEGAPATPQELTIRVLDAAGAVAVEFTPLPDEKPAIPPAATPAKDPKNIASNEELFLNGLHLEQYRHATYAPEAYYEEALRRDAGDARCNNAMGLLLYRRGKFADAEPFFRRAIERLTLRNPNPYDGEPYYNLGLTLRMQGRFEDAADAFWKATWSEAWKAPAFFELARLAARRGAFGEALELAKEALARNTRHHQARHLKAACLRHLGRPDEAMAEAEAALVANPFSAGALLERRLLCGEDGLAELAGQEGGATAANGGYVEAALDCVHAGLWAEARELFALAPQDDPMTHYLAAWAELLSGDEAAARKRLAKAAAAPRDFAFPNLLESVPALEAARLLAPGDALAPYALGNFWLAHRRPEEAIACWEAATRIDPAFATAWRNLGLARMNKRADAAGAREALEKAFALDPADARVFFELDQLFKKTNMAPAERLARIEQHADLALRRDDLLIERITLTNMLGRHAEALDLLLGHVFHPWEGGEGKATGQYVACQVELAREAIERGDPDAALARLEAARTCPTSLGEGKLCGARENHLDYWTGRARLAKGDPRKAREAFGRAAKGSTEPTSAMYYNDQPPDMIFYQGLACRALGDADRARTIFQGLADYGTNHLTDQVKMDYFAVSLPDFLVFEDDLEARHQVHCHYMAGLGALGLDDQAGARRSFDAALALQADHFGARMHGRLEIYAVAAVSV
jgi:tetratricopeptide (TPR) repeat protein